MTTSNPGARPDGGPPFIALPFLIALGVGAAYIMSVEMPKKVAEVRRVWAMTPVEARVVEHRDVHIPRGNGPRPLGERIGHEIRVEYAVGEGRYAAWMHFSTQMLSSGAPPADPRPAVGSTARVWYHPDAPDRPAPKEPVWLGPVVDVFILLVIPGLWLALGIYGSVATVRRLVRLVWAGGGHSAPRRPR